MDGQCFGRIFALLSDGRKHFSDLDQDIFDQMSHLCARPLRPIAMAIKLVEATNVPA